MQNFRIFFNNKMSVSLILKLLSNVVDTYKIGFQDEMPQMPRLQMGIGNRGTARGLPLGLKHLQARQPAQALPEEANETVPRSILRTWVLSGELKPTNYTLTTKWVAVA